MKHLGISERQATYDVALSNWYVNISLQKDLQLFEKSTISLS